MTHQAIAGHGSLSSVPRGTSNDEVAGCLFDQGVCGKAIRDTPAGSVGRVKVALNNQGEVCIECSVEELPGHLAG
jgi:hypothetical protein